MAEIELAAGPEGAPVETAPVGATPGATRAPAERPKGLVRWGVALLVVAVMVGVVSVASALLAAGAGASAVQGWLPNGTVVYVAVRSDLPGDQRARVGDLLARFPGFADQASLDAKIDEAIERILDDSGVSWVADIKPWLGGEVGLAVTTAAFDGTAIRDRSASPDSPDPEKLFADGAVALVEVKDSAAAQAWVSKELGGTQTTQTHAGGEITIVSGLGRDDLAFAVRGSVLVLGSPETVKASLDTGGAGTVASSPSFVAARRTAPSSYLGYVYVDMRTLVRDALDATGEDAPVPTACRDAALDRVPTWVAGAARADDDALVFEATAATATTAPSTRSSASAVALHLPASTVAAVEVRDLGVGIVAALDGLRAVVGCDPSAAEEFDQLERALIAVGGAEALFGWADDAALAATADGTEFGGGIVAIVADEEAAGRTIDQIRALLALGGAGSGFSSREEAYGDGTLLVIAIPSEMGGTEAGEVAATVQGGLFALGTVDFVKAVLDTTEASSLARNPVYERAIALAGGDGVSDVFIHIAGIRAAFEGNLPAEEMAEYETEIRPFIEPLEAFASVAEAPGATTEIRAVITFTK